MKLETSLFNEHKIRRIYDEESDVWWFSVVDIVQVLTQHTDYKAARNYWQVLKNRLSKEGRQLVTDCNQLKMVAAYTIEVVPLLNKLELDIKITGMTQYE